MSSTFSDAEGRPIVAVDTAEDIGEIKGFIVDTAATRIDGLHISGRGRKAEILPWSAIRSFGDDAIIADDRDSAERVADDHEKEAAKGNIAMRGARVLSTDGTEIGTVDDVMFDPDSGAITGLLSDRGHIDSSRLRALGSYALVVDPE